MILGYVFTVLNYISYCLSRFMKKKKDMLALNLLAKIFTVLGFFCLHSLTGAYNMTVAIVLLIIANIKERKKKKWTPLNLVFVFAYIFILVSTFSGISSILVFITSNISLICIWFLPPQQMRLVGGCASFVYLSYQISIKNWAGLLEIFVIISYFLSFKKYKKQQ